jgi:hypothetical protein
MTLEGVPARLKVAQRLCVKRGAATLELHLAVPSEPEVLERALNFISAARLHARAVEVLDAQQPTAAMLARLKEAAERGN